MPKHSNYLEVEDKKIKKIQKMPWFFGVHFKLSHPVIASLRSNPEGNIILCLSMDCFANKLSRNDGKVVKRQIEMHPICEQILYIAQLALSLIKN